MDLHSPAFSPFFSVPFHMISCVFKRGGKGSIANCVRITGDFNLIFHLIFALILQRRFSAEFPRSRVVVHLGAFVGKVAAAAADIVVEMKMSACSNSLS